MRERQSIPEDEKKRYTAVFPKKMWEMLCDAADADKTSVIAVIQRYVEQALPIIKQVPPGGSLFVKLGNTETKILELPKRKH